jgi:hypothetical protein
MASKMKSALAASLQAEDAAFKSRFERAEAVLGSGDSKEIQSPSSQKLETIPNVIVAQVVRDTFTFPDQDYALISEIQERCLRSATMINKSEIVRAGLNSLSKLSDSELLEIISGLTKIKPGRPPRKQK